MRLSGERLARSRHIRDDQQFEFEVGARSAIARHGGRAEMGPDGGPTTPNGGRASNLSAGSEAAPSVTATTTPLAYKQISVC